MKIGFIGQGFIGKSYADDFEERGYSVVRYAKEVPYKKNKNAIAECDIVLIAVPTPTTPLGFDDNILREVIPLVGKGNIAVIKSTILPGVTESIQEENPDITVFHSPEFLTEKTAAHDARHPERNIIGVCMKTPELLEKAEEVMAVLPKAKYESICTANEAAMIKYGGNCWFYFKVVYMNILYDMAMKSGVDWSVIKEGMAADPRIGPTHLEPIHQSGRGAGGHCFIKDFAALRELHARLCADDQLGNVLLLVMEEKNKKLLIDSGKDLELLAGVYGD